MANLVSNIAFSIIYGALSALHIEYARVFTQTPYSSLKYPFDKIFETVNPPINDEGLMLTLVLPLILLALYTRKKKCINNVPAAILMSASAQICSIFRELPMVCLIRYPKNYIQYCPFSRFCCNTTPFPIDFVVQPNYIFCGFLLCMCVAYVVSRHQRRIAVCHGIQLRLSSWVEANVHYWHSAICHLCIFNITRFPTRVERK